GAGRDAGKKTAPSRPASATGSESQRNQQMSSDCKQYNNLLTDRPGPGIVRITLNRPDKRNAMNNALRAELFDALEQADRDPEIAVMILRGAGQCFCSGYDLSADLGSNLPYHTAGGAGLWPRHVTEGCF